LKAYRTLLGSGASNLESWYVIAPEDIEGTRAAQNIGVETDDPGYRIDQETPRAPVGGCGGCPLDPDDPEGAGRGAREGESAARDGQYPFTSGQRPPRGTQTGVFRSRRRDTGSRGRGAIVVAGPNRPSGVWSQPGNRNGGTRA
jgi:hypothetical protein